MDDKIHIKKNTSYKSHGQTYKIAEIHGCEDGLYTIYRKSTRFWQNEQDKGITVS